MMTGTYETWRAAACHIQGAGHMQRGSPCQDRASAWLPPRPALSVLDGRGSAPSSHVGVRCASRVLRSLIQCAEPELATMLDSGSDSLAELGWRGLAHRLYHAAAVTQATLAQRHKRPAHDFEFTLSIAIVGTLRCGWLIVGDSPLAFIRRGIAGLAVEPETREFANATTFVTTGPESDPVAQCGIIPSSGLDAICAMSDGTASRLVHTAGNVPATAMRQISGRIASGQWTAADLRKALSDPSWDHLTADDRSLAVIVNTSPNPKHQTPNTNQHVKIVFPTSLRRHHPRALPRGSTPPDAYDSSGR